MKAQDRAALHDASLFAAFPNKAPGTSWQLHNENTFVIIMSGARDSLDNFLNVQAFKTRHDENFALAKLGLPRSRSAQSQEGLLNRPRQLPNDSKANTNAKWQMGNGVATHDAHFKIGCWRL